MKIDSELTSLTRQSTAFNCEQESGFDQLLGLPTKQTKGGDYYWQHQEQLQKSDLMFNPLNNKSHSQQPASTESYRLINRPIDIVDVDQVNLSNQQDVLFKQGSPEIPTLLDIEINESTTPIQKIIDLLEVTLSSKSSDPIIPKNHCKQISENPIIQSATVFKNYQLFVNNNSAELTLNTNQFSKKETQELQKLIKQWLTDKGFTIKQLIINGEQQ